MGAVHVTVAVVNPADDSKRREGLFLIDHRTMDCCVPAKWMCDIGIQPETTREMELPEGTKRNVPAGAAKIEFMGEIVGATVLFGNDDAQPILGLIALSSVGIEVDPKTQRLRRRSAVRLK